MTSTNTATIEPLIYNGDGGKISRKGYGGLPPLSTIAHTYFDQDFYLENPNTCEIVSESSNIAPLTSEAEKQTMEMFRR